VKDFTARLFSDGLVHNVASDAQSAGVRPPGLGSAFDMLDEQLPGLVDQQGWFAREVPEAVLGDRELPPAPSRLARRRRGLKRLLGSPVGFSRPADGDALR
jgi:tyrosine-protein phosphatase YwqE